jgi:hypothetical protein
MLKLTALREHHFIRNIRLELSKTVFLHQNNGVFKPSNPFACIETCPWHVLRILIQPVQHLDAPRLRQCIKVSILRPQNSGSSSIPPQLRFEAKLPSLIAMSLYSLLVISRTRLLSPRDLTGFGFLLHGVYRCSTQLHLARSSAQPRYLPCGLAKLHHGGMLCVLDCLSFVFAMIPRCLCEDEAGSFLCQGGKSPFIPS